MAKSRRRRSVEHKESVTCNFVAFILAQKLVNEA